MEHRHITGRIMGGRFASAHCPQSFVSPHRTEVTGLPPPAVVLWPRSLCRSLAPQHPRQVLGQNGGVRSVSVVARYRCISGEEHLLAAARKYYGSVFEQSLLQPVPICPPLSRTTHIIIILTLLLPSSSPGQNTLVVVWQK